MRRMPRYFLPGILSIFCLGFLFVACQNEAVNPVSSTVGRGVATPLQKVAQRPISDFLSTQTFPTPWTSPKSDFAYIVDYAGWVDRAFGLNLGTTFDGTVTEQPLSDGTAEVNIDVRSHNALTWMFNWVSDPNVRVFGMDPWSVQGGATPTLGDVHFKCTMIIPAPGAPIPDIYEALFTRLTMEASAFGPIAAAAGMGPDGTPGHGWTNQVGLVTKTHGRPGIDGFTAEVVTLQRVGN